jgi:hypothetical protein
MPARSIAQSPRGASLSAEIVRAAQSHLHTAELPQPVLQRLLVHGKASACQTFCSFPTSTVHLQIIWAVLNCKALYVMHTFEAHTYTCVRRLHLQGNTIMTRRANQMPEKSIMMTCCSERKMHADCASHSVGDCSTFWVKMRQRCFTRYGRVRTDQMLTARPTAICCRLRLATQLRSKMKRRSNHTRTHMCPAPYAPTMRLCIQEAFGM